MWAEVEIAKSEQRHELVLQGKDLTEKLERNEGRLDENIFSLGQAKLLKYLFLILSPPMRTFPILRFLNDF